MKVSGPLLVVVLLFGSVSVLLLALALLSWAPRFFSIVFLLLYLVLLYLRHDRSSLHAAQEYENRFWTLLMFSFSLALFYVSDSPLACIGAYNHSLAFCLVLILTTFAHFRDRQYHRLKISRKPHLKNSAMSTSIPLKSAATEEKILRVQQCVDQIDRLFIPSTINSLINFDQVEAQEYQIYCILAGASCKEELNYMIQQIRLGLLFYKVKDRHQQNRTLILDLLCVKRLAELTVPTKVLVLDALMIMKLSAHKKAEKWAQNIILKTMGDELSQLKSLTDSKGDIHSMHQLIYRDIRDSNIRESILNHLRRVASVQTAHMRLGTKRANARRRQAWRKVLSDVDDTLYSSGGVYPAGCDLLYPRHGLYPGVLEMYRELDLGGSCVDSPNVWPEGRTGNLVFLSARPHVYKDLAEQKSYAKFTQMHHCHSIEELQSIDSIPKKVDLLQSTTYLKPPRMHTLPTMLAGSLESGRDFMLKGDLEPMARKKFLNFDEYYQIYPEFTYVFIGDNGQGDVRAAELIIEKYGTKVLEACFFHCVKPFHKTFGTFKSKAKYKACNIFFFDTYIGAAVIAYKLDLIRFYGLYDIGVNAKTQWLKMCQDPFYTSYHQSSNNSDSTGRPTTTNPKLETLRQLFNADIISLNECIQDYHEQQKCTDGFELVSLLTKYQGIALNSLVMTAFGMGIVRDYEPIYGNYKVDLVEFGRSNMVGFYQEVNLVLMEENLTLMQLEHLKLEQDMYANCEKLKKKVQTKCSKQFGNGLNYIRSFFVETRQINLDKRNALEVLFPLNSYVETAFGIGRIIKKRRIEHWLYEIALQTSAEFINKSKKSTNCKTLSGTCSNVVSYIPHRNMIKYLIAKQEKEQKLLENEQLSSSSPLLFGVRSGFDYFTNFLSSSATHDNPMTRSDTLFHVSVGAKVLTTFGEGRIIQYRPVERVYDIEIMSSNSVVAFIPELNLMNMNSTLMKEKVKNHSSSFFSLFRSSTIEKSDVIRVGSQIKTAFGTGIVRDVRHEDDIVVIDFNNNSTGYFHSTHVCLEEKDANGQSGYSRKIFNFLRSGFTSDYDVSKEPISDLKSNHIQLSDLVHTPFGLGVVQCLHSDPNVLVVQLSSSSTGLSPPLAYLCRSQVSLWGEESDVIKQGKKKEKNESSFSFNGTLSFLKETLVRSRSPSMDIVQLEEIVPVQEEFFPKYQLQNDVETPFGGPGSVIDFRQNDATYTIAFGNGTLAYIGEKSLSWPRVGTIGQPISTVYGTGILQSIRAHDGIHVVELCQLNWSIQAFLNVKSLLKPVVAVVGDTVQTAYGKGLVLKYRIEDEVYEIGLQFHKQSVVKVFIQGNNIRERLVSSQDETSSSRCLVM